MLDIVQFDHVGIRVSDKTSSITFYEALGYELKADAGFDKGHPVIMQHASGLILNLLGPAREKAGENILMDVPEKYSGYTHFALHIKSLEQAESLMDKLGIAITGRRSSDGEKAIFIRDPDRNVIELIDHFGPGFLANAPSGSPET